VSPPAPHPLDVGTGTIVMVAKKRRWLEGLWVAPDPDLVDAGRRGEWLIAGIRVLIVLLFAAVPLDFATSGETIDQEKWMLAAWVAVGGLAEALVIFTAVKRSWARNWIGFFSGMLDASLVSLGLFIYTLLGQPLEATRDLVIFPIYFLAIGATSLRYDWRISIITGATAIFQYLGLAYYAVWNWRLDHLLEPMAEIQFSWKVQLGRVLLLAAATGLATMVIVRAYEQRRRSNRDRLTNLANRGFFDESLTRLGALSARTGEPVAVAMFDVDHFKKFNDTYGHQAGDQALRAVAEMLGNSFRSTDLVARYGGEEFAGLFPGMSMEDAERRLETLRGRIEKMTVRIDSIRTARVTLSIGVAVWPEDGQELKDALAQADYRLYQAKHTGRNRVVTTSDSGYFQVLGAHTHAKKR
jgi:diguanylate cyclase (GGDEF)-like protein